MSEAGAGGVVFDDEGRVLLLRHVTGSWVFPKGHIDEGEQPLQTAIREIEEESGIRVTVPDPNLVFETSYVNDRGQERTIRWFVAHTDASRFEQREDLFPEGQFLKPEEALRLLTFPEDQRLLQEILDARGGQ